MSGFGSSFAVWQSPVTDDVEDTAVSAAPRSTAPTPARGVSTLADLPEDLVELVLKHVGYGDLCNLRATSKDLKRAVDAYDRPGVGSRSTSALSKACYLAQVAWTSSPQQGFRDLMDAGRWPWKSVGLHLKIAVKTQPFPPKRMKKHGAAWWRARVVTIQLDTPAKEFFRPPFDSAARTTDLVRVVITQRLECDGVSDAYTLRSQTWRVLRHRNRSWHEEVRMHKGPGSTAWAALTSVRPYSYGETNWRNPHIIFALDTIGTLRRACTLIDTPRDGLVDMRGGACVLAGPIVRAYCCL